MHFGSALLLWLCIRQCSLANYFTFTLWDRIRKLPVGIGTQISFLLFCKVSQVLSRVLSFLCVAQGACIVWLRCCRAGVGKLDGVKCGAVCSHHDLQVETRNMTDCKASLWVLGSLSPGISALIILEMVQVCS